MEFPLGVLVKNFKFVCVCVLLPVQFTEDSVKMFSTLWLAITDSKTMNFYKLF